MANEFILRKGLISLGGVTFPYKAITATYSITADDQAIECTSGTFTVTLPTAVGIAGRIYSIKNSGSGTITTNTTSSQTIDEQLTRTLSRNESLYLQANGSNWIISNKTPVVMLFMHDTTGISINGSTTYYIGQLYGADPSTTAGPARRALAMSSGWITKVSQMSSCITPAGTTNASTLQIRNVTTSTNGVITTTVQYNNTSQLIDHTLATPLRVTRGDTLEMQWLTGAWGTGANRPANVRQTFNVLIE
jgi:hypothetical protein